MNTNSTNQATSFLGTSVGQRTRAQLSLQRQVQENQAVISTAAALNQAEYMRLRENSPTTRVGSKRSKKQAFREDKITEDEEDGMLPQDSLVLEEGEDAAGVSPRAAQKKKQGKRAKNENPADKPGRTNLSFGPRTDIRKSCELALAAACHHGMVLTPVEPRFSEALNEGMDFRDVPGWHYCVYSS